MLCQTPCSQNLEGSDGRKDLDDTSESMTEYLSDWEVS